MNDIQKLKYDLVMNCAMVDVLRKAQKGEEIVFQNAMLESFQGFYDAYCIMDQAWFENFFKSLAKKEENQFNSNKLLKK